MKRLSKYLFFLPLCAISCSQNLDMAGMFNGQSPRSDERFETSMAYNEEHGYEVIAVPKEEYRVWFGTDMHVDTTTYNVKAWITQMRNDSAAAVGIILGDMINAQDHFPRFMEALDFDAQSQKYRVPLFATAGNHDLYFGQWTEYVKYWHTSTYWFEVQTPVAKDLYICLDSSDGTIGVKQMQWLRNLLAQKDKENYRHTLVFTHTHMFKKDCSQGHTSNFPMEETYELTDLLSRYKVDWYVSGHDHGREVSEFKGVQYIIVNTMQDPDPEPYFMVATMGERMNYEYRLLVR